MSLDWLRHELQQLDEAGLRRPQRQVRLASRHITIDGTEFVDFGSNDYLGLARHPNVVSAAARALPDSGVGARSSALINGRSVWHNELEKHLADFEGAEAALLFPSGYAANVGVVSSLAGRGDLICSDRQNHASLIDGCRLSRAMIRLFDRSNLTELASILANSAAQRKFIVTDSVFSMDGEIAPLESLCDLAEQHGATLIVDEAHGTGIFGQRGSGVCELLELEQRIPVRLGTLSKSIGALGGFVVGSRELVDFLWHRARTQFFSTALPPAICAAASSALNLIATDSERRLRLRQMALDLKQKLVARGLRVTSDDGVPIVPVIVGGPDDAVRLAERLAEAGFFVPAIRPPSVPRGTSRLRISLSANHDLVTIDRLVDTLCAAMSGIQESVS